MYIHVYTGFLFLLQIFAGDCLIIRGQPRGGPPPERTLALSYINAPKLARRANPNFEGSTETKEEVCQHVYSSDKVCSHS